MKVMHLVRTASGGMLSHVKTLLDGIDKTVFSISIIGDFDEEAVKEFEDMGVVVYKVSFSNNSSIRGLIESVISVVKIIKKEEPNILHMHGYVAATIGKLAAIFCRINVKIVTLHNFLPQNTQKSFKSKVFKMMRKFFISGMNYYIAVSKALEDYARKEFNLKGDNILTIYNGIKPLKRPKIEQPADKKQIICIARFIQSKGIEYYIKAADLILQKRDDVEFLIVGDGPEENKLKAMVNSMSLKFQENIKFLGFRNDVEILLEKAYLFVLPSFSEGLPVSCIEAMRAGRAVVATNVGGIPEEIRDGINGTLVAPGKEDKLAKAILAYLDDEAKTKEFGQNGYKLYKELFSADKMCEEVQKIYFK
jgi:glycosyltransferase involved in cell wall biosynthesis